MTDRPAGGIDPAPPHPEAWAGLGEEDFARVVAHVRRALAELDDRHVTPAVRRLRAVPAARLVRGGGRRRLVATLARGGPLWVGVRARIEADPELVDRLAEVVVDGHRSDPVAEPGTDRQAEQIEQLQQARDDLRAERDQARRERDEARRQRDGAVGREGSLRDELERVRHRLADHQSRLAAVREERDRVLAGRDDAVAREARRAEGARRDLEESLAAARRELDELRRARARRDQGRVEPADATSSTGRADGASSRPGGPDRIRAGRPSQLPADVRLDTRAGAAALLDAVGRVMVDGYNVTRTHRGDLDLAAQRDWLVNGLGALAARRGLEATIVFDAQSAPRPTGRRRRGVQVVYSHPGITADDELVFAVEAADRDRPVVVVTDDRELRRRLAPLRVDLLSTAALVWLLG